MASRVTMPDSRDVAMPGPAGKAGRTSRLLRAAVAFGAVAGGVAGPGPGAGRAQDQVRNFAKPILVHNTDGHYAPVRSLIYAPDGSLLLSAGMDKVVNVWALGAERPRLSRAIRPPIWRGLRGQIYAMALAPTADAQGQRTLAIAGVGVENQGGNIGLYRFPGAAGPATGDLIAFLPSGVRGGPEPQGHTDTVTCLAFDPRGTTLASGSNDGTARLWDRRPAASGPSCAATPGRSGRWPSSATAAS
jgi:WD40 repeat protein